MISRSTRFEAGAASVRASLTKILLSALNSKFLNRTPCEYGFIGNVDAFSYQYLASEEKQRPGVTVKAILEEADRFRSCTLRGDGLTVIEGDGTAHEATVWDLYQLQQDCAGLTDSMKEPPQ